jgi:hypothetical protein
MAIPRTREPLQHMQAYIAKMMTTHTEELALGRWSGEAAARELVGRVKALVDLENELKKLLSPGSGNSHYAEKDMIE